jgi:hypothetical protein
MFAVAASQNVVFLKLSVVAKPSFPFVGTGVQSIGARYGALH